ncbi:hypothetical protein ZEAMMB73_Zm00001d006834 [Zea mays]|uniref:Uncharacterized protein n=1 Tax=Zea mays TaxID=4577 RepID=A0A1D6F138_MAIZE|nr:hypothetical protein ZEAMMB73_Zm00001d006834 [Zea mays]
MLAYLLHAPATAVAVAAAPCASYLRSLPPAKTPFLPSLPRPVSPRRAAAAFAFSPAAAAAPIAASLLQGPVLVWAGRLCIYYALLHVGLAGSPRNPFLSHEIGGEDGAGDSDLGFSKWAEKLRGGASGFVHFSKSCLLDCNCLFMHFSDLPLMLCPVEVKIYTGLPASVRRFRT